MLKENVWLALCSQLLLYYLPIVQGKNLGVTLNPYTPDLSFQNWITSHCALAATSCQHLPTNCPTSALTFLERMLRRAAASLCLESTCQITPLLCLYLSAGKAQVFLMSQKPYLICPAAAYYILSSTSPTSFCTSYTDHFALPGNRPTTASMFLHWLFAWSSSQLLSCLDSNATYLERPYLHTLSTELSNCTLWRLLSFLFFPAHSWFALYLEWKQLMALNCCKG